MQRSTDRIRTTHVGSLARPPALLDLMKATADGQPVERAERAERAEAERRAVTDVVARQRAAGRQVRHRSRGYGAVSSASSAATGVLASR